VGLCISQFLVLIPMTLYELRAIVAITIDKHGRTHGVLPDMGAGSVPLASVDLKAIEKAKVASHPSFTKCRMWLSWYLPMTVFFGVLGGFGYGMQEEMWKNRLSYFVVYQFTTYTVGVCATMKIALQTGMSIAQTRIRTISDFLEQEMIVNEIHMSDTQWTDRISDPCKELVDMMEQLSKAFSKGLCLDLLYKFTSFVLCTCLILSTERQNIAERTGKKWMNALSLIFLIAWMCGSVVSAYVAVYGPATVSTCWCVF
jgi:hypothetical protein